MTFFKKSNHFEPNDSEELKKALEDFRTKIAKYELNGEKIKADILRLRIAYKLAETYMKRANRIDLASVMAQWILEELPKIKLDGRNEYRYEYEGGRNEEEPEIIVFEIPNVKLWDVKGSTYRDIAMELYMFLRITKTELGKRPEAETEGKVLLYGPPGTGKTHIAQAVANELRIPALYIVTSLIWQKYVGESEKYLNNVFERAKECGGMVIIDEFEALGLNREGSHERVTLSITDLLLQWLQQVRPIVITITNKPWLLDEAILDRFDMSIYVPPPDDEARVAIFRYYLFEKFKVAAFSESNLSYLADLTRPKEINGKVYYYTARTIKKIVKRASFLARKRSTHGKVTLTDIKEALKDVKLNVSEDDLKKYEEFEKNAF